MELLTLYRVTTLYSSNQTSVGSSTFFGIATLCQSHKTSCGLHTLSRSSHLFRVFKVYQCIQTLLGHNNLYRSPHFIWSPNFTQDCTGLYFKVPLRIISTSPNLISVSKKFQSFHTLSRSPQLLGVSKSYCSLHTLFRSTNWVTTRMATPQGQHNIRETKTL